MHVVLECSPGGFPPSVGGGAEEQHFGGMAKSAAGREEPLCAPASSFSSICASKALQPFPRSSSRQPVFAKFARGT